MGVPGLPRVGKNSYIPCTLYGVARRAGTGSVCSADLYQRLHDAYKGRGSNETLDRIGTVILEWPHEVAENTT